MRTTIARLTFSVLLGSALATAQTSSGQISITVHDPSGALVPGASIQLTGSDTGELARTLSTNESGTATAALLRPGAYTVTVSREGFKRLERSGINLRVDDAIALRLTIEQGVVTESITIAAQAELLAQTTHSTGQVVDDRTMQQLPTLPDSDPYAPAACLTLGAE